MRIASEIFTSVSSAGLCALTGVHHAEFLSHLRDFVLQVVSDELGGCTELIEQRSTVVYMSYSAP